MLGMERSEQPLIVKLFERNLMSAQRHQINASNARTAALNTSTDVVGTNQHAGAVNMDRRSHQRRRSSSQRAIAGSTTVASIFREQVIRATFNSPADEVNIAEMDLSICSYLP